MKISVDFKTGTKVRNMEIPDFILGITEFTWYVDNVVHTPYGPPYSLVPCLYGMLWSNCTERSESNRN